MKVNGDADVAIVMSAVGQCQKASTLLEGEDTNLFVGHLYHVNIPNEGLKFRSDNLSIKTKRFIYLACKQFEENKILQIIFEKPHGYAI